MRVVIARTMQEFSMDVYANGIISGLKTVRPDWEIVDLAPRHFDRASSSLSLRVRKYYERFWRFPRLVKQQTADIFHIIEPAEAHIVYWLQKPAKPVVVTCHDLINFYYSDNLQGSVQLPFVSKTVWLYGVKGMKSANHIFAVSSVTAKDTTQLLNIEPSKISVTPNAVESIFQPLSQAEIESFRHNNGLSPKTICLLNVGSNHPRKNIVTILEVLNILKQKEISVKFWKVGADFTNEQKEFIQKFNLENYITYFGKPDKNTLVQIYNAADVLVAPSLHEGFGITILEAMACGTPVITSNTSAMPEVAGNAAILVNSKDSKAISEAVLRLHNDHVYYQELVDKGLVRTKLFTWEKTAEKLAEIYEKLLYS
ncbi:MAG: glycosyltransferase family 4 protein [Mojavia pulchra JT2-VF2]|jgi:glycosyltransferase involved in cell wall biosynthesis|uniref:Glycosyltransferase family 4 protein n=1 Tax=Mojavia pulchra JT2-VF2 TaxID=287848 RepID=A0A951PVH8_9NOST|nr:glycosyltransferase family 4 protein [Mojavia pulchra JT2-VF2]